MNRLTITGSKFLAPMQASKEQLLEEIKRHQKYYDKLAEFEDLEEQGLLIKLPCKVRDYVYEANKSRNIISTYKITAIVIGRDSRNYNWGLLDGVYSNMNGFNEFALGKTVFLTREEAEKALNKEEK